MNPALLSIAATGLLLAAGIPDAAPAPREAVSLVYAPAEGTVLRRVHENRAFYEVVEVAMTLDGEPPPFELPEPEVSIEALEQIVVVDTLGAVEDGRPARLEREFAELTWETEYSSAEQEQTTEDVCDLEGATVAFDWDADDEHYDVSVDEDADVDVDDADLELLNEDMDLRSFLPDGEVEVGDEWELEVAAYLALIWPGGVLRTHAEGEEVDEVQLELSLALIDDVDFAGTATLEEVEEADERRVAVIGQKAHRHPVEKPPAPLGPLDPEPVHRRDQPEQPGDPAKRQLRGGLAVDPHLPRRTFIRDDLDLVDTGQRVQEAGDLPAEGVRPPRHVLRRRAPQAPPRRQERHRLDQVGLARAIGPKDRHGPRIEREPRRFMRAEMREGQFRQVEAGHSRPFHLAENTPAGGSDRCHTRIGITT